MTREEAKKRAELYTALVEGKTIQCINTKGAWEDLKIEEFFRIYDSNNYRIKPEPKYRPFENQEECWQEMQKHQPFGWVIKRYTRRVSHLMSVYSTMILLPDDFMCSYEMAFKRYKFSDGTPFGIKED